MLRKKSKRHFYIVTVIVVLLVIWTAWSNTTVGITHYTVASDKLPASFDHYSIAYILNQYGTISDRKIFTEPV